MMQTIRNSEIAGNGHQYIDLHKSYWWVYPATSVAIQNFSGADVRISFNGVPQVGSIIKTGSEKVLTHIDKAGHGLIETIIIENLSGSTISANTIDIMIIKE